MGSQSYERRLFINNEYIESTSTKTISLINPYDDSVIPDVQVAGEAEVGLAVTAATVAFKTGPWANFTGAQRAKCLNKFADLIEEQAVELGKLDAVSMGGPLAVGIFLVGKCVEAFRYYAGWADKIEGESFAAEDGTYQIVRHEPLGVCAGIAPWNAPMLYLGWKLAPALAAGNTYIFKSSEQSPLSALALGTLVIEAGFPPGVINFISGDGKTGALLASHQGIQKISFTGSTATGRKIQIAAATSNMKVVTLELGGKSAAIVFEDAELTNAVGSTADGFLLGSGQVCVAGSRLLVHETIAPAFIEAIKARFEVASSNLGGDPQEVTTVHGPMAYEQQFKHVMSYIEDERKNAEPIIGGGRKGEKGFFINPTIFVNPNREGRAWKEEIFGPVLTVVTFKTEDEAMELANNTETGLSSSIYTSDLNRALRLSAKIEAGSVSINAPHFPNILTPFGGFKLSGSGKELGKYGLQSYLRTKTILVNMNLPMKE